MSDRSDVANAPLLAPDGGDRNGVRWDGWRVVFPTDADDSDEHTAALKAQRLYGEPLRYATEDDIAAEVARRTQDDRVTA
jgi:hypothetical protein